MDDEYEITVDELDTDACWRFLAGCHFGRVGFVQDGAVLVLPVNVAISDEHVIFRTSAGSSLAAAGNGAAVAFEADSTDRVAESGWSVMVRGSLWDLTDVRSMASWKDVEVHPWAPGASDRWMAVEPTLVTGRAIQRHRNVPAGVRLPYMPPD